MRATIKFVCYAATASSAIAALILIVHSIAWGVS